MHPSVIRGKGNLVIYPRSSLASDHDRARRKRQIGIAFEPVVHGDNVEAVKQLTLVLVDALHLQKKKESC